MSECKISGLYYYPIKSFRGLKVDELWLEPEGPRHDREWMLVDERGRFLTQRTVPQLTQIEVQAETGGFTLAIPEEELVSFCGDEVCGPEIEVTVWKSKVAAFEVRPELSAALSRFLTKPVRLVKLSKTATRRFAADHERHIRFVDAQPLLVIGQASLEDLCQRSGLHLEPLRFRANIIVEGSMPYAEDDWSEFESCGIKFAAIEACTRCVITTLDPSTGVRGPEPLKTLSAYRRHPEGVAFGFYYAHLSEGLLKAGAHIKPAPKPVDSRLIKQH